MINMKEKLGSIRRGLLRLGTALGIIAAILVLFGHQKSLDNYLNAERYAAPSGNYYVFLKMDGNNKVIADIRNFFDTNFICGSIKDKDIRDFFVAKGFEYPGKDYEVSICSSDDRIKAEDYGSLINDSLIAYKEDLISETKNTAKTEIINAILLALGLIVLLRVLGWFLWYLLAGFY